MTDQEKIQDKKIKIESLSGITDYVEKNKEALKQLDASIFNSLEYSIDKLSKLEAETTEENIDSELSTLLSNLSKVQQKMTDEIKKEELQILIDSLEKEKIELEKLKNDIK
jgi:hypothetical protein